MAFFEASSFAEDDFLSDFFLEPQLNDCLPSIEPQWEDGSDRIPRMLGLAGENTSANPCPSPWTSYQQPWSPAMNTLGFSTLDQETSRSSGSPASFHASSGYSSQKNSLYDQESYFDPSSPSTAYNTLSPSPTISSLYSSDTYASQFPMPLPSSLLDVNFCGESYGTGYPRCDQIGKVEPSAEVAAPGQYLSSMDRPPTSINVDLALDGKHSKNNSSTNNKIEELGTDQTSERRESSRKSKSIKVEKSSPKLSKQPSGRIEKPSSRGRPSTKIPKARTKTCPVCKTIFPDQPELAEHLKLNHSRPYPCVFDFAGCEADFAAKNEWKRHVFTQHLYLEYWHCQLGECATSHPPSSQYRCPTLPQTGCIFNRKDLYVQHLRRMHQPQCRDTKEQEAWEERMRELLETSRRTRAEMPKYMRCPMEMCDDHFFGPRAWDDRMEHIADHLERAAGKSLTRSVLGGEHDVTLSSWAGSAAVNVVKRVNGVWQLNNPVRPRTDDDTPISVDNEDTEQDAEGELADAFGSP